MNIPCEVVELLDCLNKSNYEAYVVGGCVRDTLLGLKPHDWDICTSASPQEMIEFFSGYRVLKTGLKHGTLTVLVNEKPIEVTTFRTDGEYKDHRHPESVVFVKTLKEDLSRRDFTVNAMAYHPQSGIQDPFGGREDLKKGILRCVGKATERFDEDALRILRGLRFAATYALVPETETAKVLHNCANLLGSVSAERIQVELCRMLVGKDIGKILEDFSDVFFAFLPELKACDGFWQFSPYHDRDVLNHTIAAIQHSAQDLTVRLTLLLHDIGKPLCFTKDENGNGHFFGHAKHSEILTTDILKRLRFDNKTISDVCLLIKYHDSVIEQTETAVKRWLNRLGAELFDKLLLVKEGDCKGHAVCLLEPRMEELSNIRKIRDVIIEQRQCFSLRDLSINGNDVLSLGYSGEAVGEQLQWALNAVIEKQLPNEKSVLLSAIAKRS